MRVLCQGKQEASLRKSLLQRIHCQEKQESFPGCLTTRKKEVNISSQFQRQRTPVPVQKVRKTGQRTKERKLTSLISNSPRQRTKGRKEVIPLRLSTDLPWIHTFRSGRKQIPKQAVMSLLRTFNIHQLLG